MTSDVPEPTRLARELGTMVAYGFARGHLATDLALASRLGATCLEILPDWRNFPNPADCRSLVQDAGLRIHSAHGCWGGQSIRADRVDLGHLDERVWRASLDDLKRCLDWLAEAGGVHLVIHPGGLSDPTDREGRRGSLERGLLALADHARDSGLVVCVENMPPGVHPGSRMADVAEIVAGLDRPELAVALDTGHAHLSADLPGETRAAGRLLRTTHVHDNNGQSDTHDPPGLGTIDWQGWPEALDAIGYTGPIMLECIRHLRDRPESWTQRLFDVLGRLTR